MTSARKNKRMFVRRSAALPWALIRKLDRDRARVGIELGRSAGRRDPGLFYILVGKHYASVPMWKYLLTEKRRGHKGRRVAYTEVDGINVSTVFLPIDHGWGVGRPILFETMAFIPKDKQNEHNIWLDQHMRRYSTWREAVAGHREVVRMVRAVRTQVAAVTKVGAE